MTPNNQIWAQQIYTIKKSKIPKSAFFLNFFSENPLYKIGALREHFPVALSLKMLCVACYDIKEWD